MNVKYISGWLGLDTLHSPRIVDDRFVIDCKNVLFRDGTIKRRWGYIPILQPLPEQDTIRHMLYFNQYEDLQYSLVIISEHDVFTYDEANAQWLYITPIYNTGTASCSGSTVTGTGTTWTSANYVKNGCYIKFGSNDPNVAGTWYRITNVNSATSLTIDGNVTVSSGSYCIRCVLSGGESDWTIATKHDGSRYLIIVNGSDAVYWEGGVSVSNLCKHSSAIEAYTPKYVGFFGSASGQHLLLGNITDTGVRHPNTIQISDIGNPFSYSQGYYIDLYDSNDQIKGFRKIRDYIAVYKEHSISLLSPSYTLDLFSVKENVVSDIGTVNIRTVGNFGNYHIFMGQDNIYIFDGASLQEIGNLIKPQLYSQISWDYIHKAFAFTDTINNLYMLFVPVGSADEPNVCYVYDLYCQAWTRFEFGHTITALSDVLVPYAYSWDDITAAYTASGGTTHTWNWFMQNWLTWNQLKGTYSYRVQLIGDEYGNIYRWDTSSERDSNIPIRAFVETKDYALNEPYQLASVGDVRMYLERIPQTEQFGNFIPTLMVSGSMNYGYEWSQTHAVQMHTPNVKIIDKTASFALRGNYLRLRFENTNNGDKFSLEGVAITYNDAGV